MWDLAWFCPRAARRLRCVLEFADRRSDALDATLPMQRLGCEWLCAEAKGISIKSPLGIVRALGSSPQASQACMLVFNDVRTAASAKNEPMISPEDGAQMRPGMRRFSSRGLVGKHSRRPSRNPLLSSGAISP